MRIEEIIFIVIIKIFDIGGEVRRLDLKRLSVAINRKYVGICLVVCVVAIIIVIGVLPSNSTGKKQTNAFLPCNYSWCQTSAGSQQKPPAQKMIITHSTISRYFPGAVFGNASTSTANIPINPTIQQSAPPSSTTSASATTSYVTLSGQNFIYNNTLIHPYGSTMYPNWCTSPSIGTLANNNNAGTCTKYTQGSGWIDSNFTNYIDFILSLAQQFHSTVIRPTNFFDGISYGDWENPTVWANMDYLFQQAASHNMYVLLDLSSFRDKTLKSGIYPYDATLFTNEFAWVANRYKHKTNLLNYAIAGEVQCPNTSHDPLKPTSTQALTDFYNTLSTTLHTADPNHLVSTGGFSFLNLNNCGIDWQGIDALPTINITAIHVYSNNDRNITMPMVSQWAAANMKPFTVEEFGFTQNNDDAGRAANYQNMYNLAKQFNVTTMVFWNLGDQSASSSYEVGPTTTPLTFTVVLQNAP